MSTLRRWMLVAALVFLSADGQLPAAEKLELKLWPKGVPGESPDDAAKPDVVDSGKDNVIHVRYVAQPTITLYRAPEKTANGCAVVVCPGGGYNILAWDKEGTEVAEWLNTLGVTAVLLKYRVPRRDKEQPHKAPLQDSQRAVRLVRQNASRWKVDSNRVGVLGFSAGGHLTVMTGTHWDETTYAPVDEADRLSCRPDFMVPVYAAYLGDEANRGKLSSLVRVTQRTPPTFMVVTYDDKDRGMDAALLLAELKKVDVPAEVHVYLKGGHGYGLRPSDNPVSAWPKLCENWMRALGLLEPARSTAQ